jgi:hypothetical protein
MRKYTLLCSPQWLWVGTPRPGKCSFSVTVFFREDVEGMVGKKIANVLEPRPPEIVRTNELLLFGTALFEVILTCCTHLQDSFEECVEVASTAKKP